MTFLLLFLLLTLTFRQINCETFKCDQSVTPNEDDLVGWGPTEVESEKFILSDTDKRLVVLGMNQKPVWMTWEQLKGLLERGENFLDVTDGAVENRSVQTNGISKKYPVPEEMRFEEVVTKMIEKISVDKMERFLTHWSTVFTCRRGEKDDDSRNASAWIYQEIAQILEKYEGPCANISKYRHSWILGKVWLPMKSVIVRLRGADPVLRKEVVVLGAHIDAHPVKSCPLPAADDGGSGVTAIMEALRILVQSKFVPKRTVEFHFYTYEEMGLLGANQIAQWYRNHSVNVVGMLNLDIVGYAPKDKPEAFKVAISQLDTNPQLNQFLTQLIIHYLRTPAKIRDVCVGCNFDHFAWTYHGYPSAFPHEMILNPHLHTSKDVVDNIDFYYLKEFAKLAVAYAIEYGVPTSTN